MGAFPEGVGKEKDGAGKSEPSFSPCSCGKIADGGDEEEEAECLEEYGDAGGKGGGEGEAPRCREDVEVEQVLEPADDGESEGGADKETHRGRIHDAVEGGMSAFLRGGLV